MATREAVFAACDAITIEGRIPSLREVCSRTGGSMSTISPLRREWALRLAAGLRGDLPAAVPDEVAQSFGQFWQLAITEARQQLAPESMEPKRDAAGMGENGVPVEFEQELKAALVEASLLKDELLQVAREHGGAISSLTSLIDDLRGQIRTVEDAHSAEMARMGVERERLTAQLEAQQREITRLRASQPSSN